MKKFLRSSVLRYIIIGLLAAVIGINLYSFNAARLAGNQLPMPLGFGAAVVLSGSMEPEFSAGDLIFVQKADRYDLKDIVVFQDGRSLVVHRIVQIDGEMVTTQGDANNAPDAPIPLTAIKGKVTCCIPYAGDAVGLLQTPTATLVIIAAAILLLEIPRLNEKKRDNAEKQKILEEIRRLREQD